MRLIPLRRTRWLEFTDGVLVEPFQGSCVVIVIDPGCALCVRDPGLCCDTPLGWMVCDLLWVDDWGTRGRAWERAGWMVGGVGVVLFLVRSVTSLA